MNKWHAHFVSWAHRSPVRHLSRAYQLCHSNGAKRRPHPILEYHFIGTKISDFH